MVTRQRRLAARGCCGQEVSAQGAWALPRWSGHYQPPCHITSSASTPLTCSQRLRVPATGDELRLTEKAGLVRQPPHEQTRCAARSADCAHVQQVASSVEGGGLEGCPLLCQERLPLPALPTAIPPWLLPPTPAGPGPQGESCGIAVGQLTVHRAHCLPCSHLSLSLSLLHPPVMHSDCNAKDPSCVACDADKCTDCGSGKFWDSDSCAR